MKLKPKLTKLENDFIAMQFCQHQGLSGTEISTLLDILKEGGGVQGQGKGKQFMSTFVVNDYISLTVFTSIVYVFGHFLSTPLLKKSKTLACVECGIFARFGQQI